MTSLRRYPIAVSIMGAVLLAAALGTTSPNFHTERDILRHTEPDEP